MLPQLLLPLLAVLGHVAGGASGPSLRIAPGPGCWDHPCTANSIKTEGIVIEESKGIVSAADCQTKCSEKENDECKFFNFVPRQLGGNVCYLLATDCPTKAANPYNPEEVSGPASCEEKLFCEPLKTPTSAPHVALFWTSDNSEINPYTDQMPVDTVLSTSCGKNEDGVENKYRSKCVVDSTGTATEWQNDNDDFKPDVADAKDAKCNCPDFPFWYDPNAEPGASFFCTVTTDFSTATVDNEILLDMNDECVLICNNYLVAEIMCSNGAWTDIDNIDDGVACYKAPPTRSSETESPTVLFE